MMADTNVVVLGAGVIGLTSALLLSKNPRYSITVVAQHMPGDYDILYASPWAGANYLPVSKPGTPFNEYEKNTWPELDRLARDVPEAGIHYQETVLYNRKKDVDSAIGVWQRELLRPDPWYKDMMPNFKVLSEDELPSGIDSGTSFTSVCINTSIYLPYLAGQCLKAGVKIKRGIVSHISDAADLHSSANRATVVVNCTGLGARSLKGVEDESVVPARGQICIVRNEPNIMSGVSGTDDGEDECVYIMQRAAGGGTILGGCYQKGSWESQPDLNLATRIMQRCVDICPQLTAPGNGGVPGKTGINALSIVRHGVGLRPLRADGPRVEKEDRKDEGVTVVHAYGHGGAGYQSSYGSAMAVCKLLEDALEDMMRSTEMRSAFDQLKSKASRD